MILATAVHYAVLKRLNAGEKFIERYPRWRLLYGVVMSLIAHVIEIAIFAAAYGISTVSEFGYLEAVSRFDPLTIFISLLPRLPPGVWRHCPAGTLAIIGGWKPSPALS
ncbi:MAG: hypothetical protein CM15mP74_14460 [Halieaceae bacterium]|nr:MAG: hypothetical protein CM15mP74_14460 [Halieaceae bacterium]